MVSRIKMSCDLLFITNNCSQISECTNAREAIYLKVWQI